MKTPYRMLPGNQLTGSDRQHVLSAYVHRFTKDHKPGWAAKPRPYGNPYPVQFASDADWLAHTLFHVTSGGNLDGRFGDCQSSPTWPDNPELRRPA